MSLQEIETYWSLDDIADARDMILYQAQVQEVLRNSKGPH